MRKLVYLKWMDASYTDDYENANDILQSKYSDDLILEDGGIFIKETKTHIVYASQYQKDGDRFRYVHRLPKVSIIYKKIVNIPNNTKKRKRRLYVNEKK